MVTRQLVEQLESVHSLSVEIAALRDLADVYERALTHGLALTGSRMGFVGLLDDERSELELVGIKGFQPSDQTFYERFKCMPVRPSVFGVTITEERSNIANDVENDPNRIGQPPGHPPVDTFLGVPLRVRGTVIGMMGVACKRDGYDSSDERLLSIFANQVAVAIDNARLYERQREMIAGMQQLHQRLGDRERDELVTLERKRIAAGLHEDIVQDMFTVGLRLNSLLQGELEPALARELAGVRTLIVRASDRVRDVIFALAPSGHGDSGLVGSVRSLLSDAHLTAGIETDLLVSGIESAGVGAVQDVVCAVIREALINVAKHAEARMVLVSIRLEENFVEVVIQDDGVGAPEPVLRNLEQSYLHFGLRNMRQQVLERAGTFEIANGEEGGVVIKVTVPLAGGPA